MTTDSDDLPEFEPIPEFKPKSFADYMSEQRCLWWDPVATRWTELPYESFLRARGSWWMENLGGPVEGEVLERCGPGDHRFLICVLDDAQKTCLNFWSHRYIIDDKGLVDRFPTTLTEEEEAEYKRLDLKRCTAKEQPELDPEENARFEVLAMQQWEVTRVPPDLLFALKRDIPWSTDPGDHVAGGFWRAYQQHSKAIDNIAEKFGITR